MDIDERKKYELEKIMKYKIGNIDGIIYDKELDKFCIKIFHQTLDI